MCCRAAVTSRHALLQAWYEYRDTQTRLLSIFRNLMKEVLARYGAFKTTCRQSAVFPKLRKRALEISRGKPGSSSPPALNQA